MSIKQITLPFAVQAWDYSDISCFALALQAAGVSVQAWNISREGNNAYLFALKSSRPPSRRAAAKALKAWFDVSGNKGLSLQKVQDDLKATFTKVK